MIEAAVRPFAGQRVSLKDLREGSIVYLRGAFGTGPLQKATIVEVCEDVKNGLPGVDYVDEQGNSLWAYLSQVQAVYKY